MVLVATMLTPGRGILPAFTVPCTEPPATVADAGVGGADGLLLLGAGLEGGFTAGAAAGGDCAPAGVMREPLNKQKSREMRRIKMNFLLLPTQLRPSSFQHVVRDHLVQISFFSAGLVSFESSGSHGCDALYQGTTLVGP